MKKILLLVLVSLVIACTSTSNSSIDIWAETKLSGQDFNSLSSQYMSRPTFVKYFPSRKEIYINYDGYGQSPSSIYATRERGFRFRTEYAEALSNILDKFTAWNEKAIREERNIEKTIDSITLYPLIKHRFDFKTTSPGRNLLFICSGTLGIDNCGFILDADSVQTLSTILKNLDGIVQRATEKSMADDFN